MQIRTICRTAEATQDVLDALDRALTPEDRRAQAVIALYDCNHDAATLHRFLVDRFDGAAVIGGSSNGGVIDGTGAHGAGAVGLWMLHDPGGDYGAAAADKGDDPGDAAEAALREAIARSGCAGDLPDLVWVLLSPGEEEAVLDGLRRVVGDRCPIVGGSSADNDLTGAWSQIGPAGAHGNGFAVLAFFCASPPEVQFRGGYEPSGKTGRVTSVSASHDGERNVSPGRILHEIDGRPAAEVYNAWIGGGLSDRLAEGGTVLGDTSLFPLAVVAGSVEGVTQYLLIHPETILPGGAITTFAEVEPGAELHAMTGSRPLLIERAGAVTRQARDLLDDPGVPSGALVIFCGGCRMAIGDEWSSLGPVIKEALSDAPFLIGFTFGEQGPSGGRNAHGNLMTSAVVFP